MKKLFTVILIFCSILMNGQELSKKEFNSIYLETGKIREFIMNKEVNKLGEKLEISDFTNFEDLKKVFTDYKVDFNDKTAHTYAQPYFYLTDSKNVLELTIPGMKILEKQNGEKYERGEYYFVIKAEIEYNWDEQTVYFKNPRLLTEEKGIGEWWLGQWKNYMPEVVKVSDKFGYKPPPPPCPPKNLKS